MLYCLLIVNCVQRANISARFLQHLYFSWWSQIVYAVFRVAYLMTLLVKVWMSDWILIVNNAIIYIKKTAVLNTLVTMTIVLDVENSKN